ncbi:MAG: hypothetical protein JKY81_00120 [Colwellia sp.]|nr:hypothetical protein [Colwellia sp.]
MSRFIPPFADVGKGITPSSGAKYFFFESNTSTPKNTYTDEALTTPNTNPVISDSNGLFPDIWLEDGQYKVRLTDKNDIQKNPDADPISNLSSSISTGPELDEIPINSNLRVDTIALLGQEEPTVNLQSILLNGHTNAGIGGGEFFFDASDTTSADNNGTIIVTSGGKRWKRIYDGAVDVAWFGAIGDGVTKDSTAFQNAADTGDFHISECPVYFLVGGLSVPEGRTVTGQRVYTYTAFDVADIEGKNAVVYDTSESTFISWGEGCEIRHCSFHGVDRSRDFLDTGSGATRFRMFQCDVFRCADGFGRGGSVVGNSRLLECHFSGNTNGINAITDSHIYMCEINANEGPGIRVTAGNNDTVYIGNKVEFNNTFGYQFFGGNTSNMIIGGVIDRNGSAGISVTSDAELSIIGVKLRRNGRFSELVPEQDCQIAIRGGTTDKLRISDIQTATGDDDGGGGYLSPAYTITASNSAGIIGSIVNSNLNGATTGILLSQGGGSLTVGTFVANAVDNASIVFETGTNILDSAAANVGFRTFSERESIVNTGNYDTSPVNAVFTNLPVVSTFNRAYYQLEVLTRETAGGGTGMQRFLIAARRESGSASSIQLEVIASASDIPAVTTAFNTDATELTVTLAPGAEFLNSRVVLSKNE